MCRQSFTQEKLKLQILGSVDTPSPSPLNDSPDLFSLADEERYENDTRVNNNCKFNASNKRGNSNTKCCPFWPTLYSDTDSVNNSVFVVHF